MNPIAWIIDFIVHIDAHLKDIIAMFGAWTYAILFLIVFAETGLVVTPFLPGDSLLFAAGTFAALGQLNIWAVWAVLYVAAVAGDNTNYLIGRTLGPRILANSNGRLLKRDYLDMTAAFYERHGGQTLILARFVPIIRTFAPFMAGVGRMRYLRFLAFSLGSGFAWVTGFTMLGFFFGNLPWVEHNFTLAILGIIALSLTPGVYHYVQHRISVRRSRSST